MTTRSFFRYMRIHPSFFCEDAPLDRRFSNPTLPDGRVNDHEISYSQPFKPPENFLPDILWNIRQLEHIVGKFVRLCLIYANLCNSHGFFERSDRSVLTPGMTKISRSALILLPKALSTWIGSRGSTSSSTTTALARLRFANTARIVFSPSHGRGHIRFGLPCNLFQAVKSQCRRANNFKIK